MRREIGEVLSCLEEAEPLRPEQTCTHRVARDLIQISGSPPRAELPNVAESFGVFP